MRVCVRYPGYWADGRTFEGEKFIMRLKDGSIMDAYFFHDPDTGYAFALPIEKCYALTDSHLDDTSEREEWRRRKRKSLAKQKRETADLFG